MVGNPHYLILIMFIYNISGNKWLRTLRYIRSTHGQRPSDQSSGPLTPMDQTRRTKDIYHERTHFLAHGYSEWLHKELYSKLQYSELGHVICEILGKNTSE